jgi:quinoprotein glucose dehydrogenase
VRALDAIDGRERWSYQLPAAGSAPPTTYAIDGVQYVVVVATGGQYHGFSGRSDKVVAFRLPAKQR